MIERLDVKSVEQIVALDVKCNFTDGWKKDMIISALKREDFFIFAYKVNKDIVGYIAFSVAFDTADIQLILVDTDKRKSGIATYLLEKAIEFIKVKGASKILLEVREDNISAINLYQKNGFSKIHVRKKYYSDNTSALILAKEI